MEETKKPYQKPLAEKIVFDYRNQVVASGSHSADCDEMWSKPRGTNCTTQFNGYDN